MLLYNSIRSISPILMGVLLSNFDILRMIDFLIWSICRNRSELFNSYLDIAGKYDENTMYIQHFKTCTYEYE
jgi:hypothetical protein